jgi:hypothetical protein
MNSNVTKPSRGEVLTALRNTAIKLLLVAGLAFVIIFILNSMMQSFLDREVAAISKLAEKTAAAEAALLDSKDEAETAKLQYEAALSKAEQAEAYYQKYKDLGSFQDYGQFYELYQQDVSADVIILGTSHATHGINPKYLEEQNTGHKFFNFALNGSNPTYYYEWYTKLFKESGYPKPKLIIMCVDWFMFDDSWLWRRLSNDDSPDRPVDIMRKLKKSDKKTVTKTDTGISDAVQAAIDNTVSGKNAAADNKKITIDNILEVVFSKIAVIHSRDRIFEMLGSYFTADNGTKETETAAADETTAETGSGEIPVYTLPVYKHPYLIDGSGFVTSGFYKGYIPWECGYNGQTTDAGCTDNPAQIKDFKRLLDLFQKDGIPVVFVMCPENIPGRSAPQFDEKNANLVKIAEQYVIPFLNYNTDLASEINDDYTNYSDWGHLNKAGSTLFSQKLAKDITDYLP